jgi:subfamily B ATP-binding cassette protein MsbA
MSATYLRLGRLLLRRPETLALAALGMAGAAAATGIFAILIGPALKLLFEGGAAAPAWIGGRFGSFLRVQSPAQLRVALPLTLLAVAAARAAFTTLQTRQMAELCLRTVADLQEALHAKLLQLPLSFFEGRHSGEVYAGFSNDLGHVERALTQGVTYSLRDAFQLTALVWVAVSLDWRLFLLGGCTLPIGVFAIARFARGLRAVSVEMQERQARLVAQAQDLIGGATVLQVYGAQASALRAEERAEQALLAVGRRSAVVRAAVTPTIEFLAQAALALVLLWMSLVRLDLPPEKIVSFFGAVILAYQPLKSISSNSQWIVPGLTAAARLFNLLDAPPAIVDAPQARPLAGPTRSSGGPVDVAFESVSVRYGKREVLADVNLTFRAGERLAIVGPSGAGKSTLLHLIPRLLDPAAGVVRVGGQPVRDLQLRSLRAHIGLVSQDVFLFDASLADNLRAGASRDELEEALEIAGAIDVARSLPAGLDTRLGERGLRLSGGQRQRVALARALLKRAPVLLLDEALSAVEPRLEEEILDRLLGLGRSTLVLVTHRLRTAERFDRVLVLQAGRLVESGSPATLLRGGGWFARAHATGEERVAAREATPEAEPGAETESLAK